MPKVKRILETCLYCNNLEEMKEFYTRVFALPLISEEQGRHVFLQVDRSMLLLFNSSETVRNGGEVPPHGSSGAGHIAFAMEPEDIDDWRSWLLQNDISIEKEVSWPGGAFSFYFRDPAGNSVELATVQLWGFAQ